MHTTTLALQVRGFITDNYMLDGNCVLNDDDSFIDGGIIDSTGVLELVAFLQETYGIRVEDEELTTENLDSVDKVVAYLAQKLTGPGVAAVAGGGAS
jgi:acyl carrier protein